MGKCVLKSIKIQIDLRAQKWDVQNTINSQRQIFHNFLPPIVYIYNHLQATVNRAFKTTF